MRKRNKSYLIGKEKVKLSLLAEVMVLYTENPKKSTKKKLLELINKFSKVEVYKMNI